MKMMFALPAIAVLAVSIAACGGASKGTGSDSQASSNVAVTGSAATTTTSRSASPEGYLKSDGDADPDDRNHKGPSDDDQQLLAASGGGASQADRRAINTVVKSYYAAAAAGDGTKGCSLLYSSLAAGLAEGQGQPPSGAGRSCASSLSRLFEQQHQHLAADEVTTMILTGVHVKGKEGLATLGFRTMPEGEIILEREGHAWKINALFDSEMP